MASTPATKAGRGKCPCCGHSVMFKTSSGGKLRYTCDECDTVGYAEPGGAGFAKWLGTIKTEAPAPGPAPAPAPAAGFDLGRL